jgi:hypothetical protein
MGKVEVVLKARPVVARVAAAIYVLAWIALAVSGVVLWRLYCEGFGCIGKGIAWFAWTIGFGITVVVGFLARRSYSGTAQAGLRYLLGLQAVAGVALVIYWAAWRAA